MESKLMSPKITFILTCNAHLLRRIAKAIEKDMPELKSMKNFLMKCSALIIMCRTMEELDVVFNDILHVILERDATKAQVALIYLSAAKNKSKGEIEYVIKNSEKQEFYREIEEEFYDFYKSSNTVYQNSKFYEYYWKKFIFAKDSIDDESSLAVTNE